MFIEELQKSGEDLFRYGNILNDFNYADGEELPHRITIIYYEQAVWLVHKCQGIVLAVINLDEQGR